MYTSIRLEWHLGDELSLKPRRFLCGLDRQQASLLTQFNRLAVVLAKNQDHRASCGVFAFGQRNTVRQWLRLRYLDTRQTKSGNVGLVLERGGCRQSETVQLRWHGSEEQIIEVQANFGYDHGKAVLCSNIHQRAVVDRRE
jgi:hypothetical protein